MVYIGLIIVLITVYAIIKGYETRMVLIVSGVTMSFVALQPFAALVSFHKMMTVSPLVPFIITCLGFAAVLKYTGCDEHLIRALASKMSYVKFIILPATTVIVFLLNICITSSAGLAAAIGPIMIPILVSMGIRPAVAAAAILAGTFGHILNPGTTHNIMLAQMAEVTPVDVVLVHLPITISCLLAGAFCIFFIAKFRKEDQGYVDTEGILSDKEKGFQVNVLKALVPILPITLIVLASPQIGVIKLTKEISDAFITIAMIFGSIVAFIVSRKSPTEVSKAFFTGLGNGYGSVVGIIIAAAAFTGGMQAIGLTGALIEVMKDSDAVVKIASVYGPWFIATLVGSGDAATVAFNQAVTPSAELFNMTIPQLGSIAQVSGVLGRTMSPVAGVTIILAALAKVSPIEVVKRTAPGMLVSTLIVLFCLA